MKRRNLVLLSACGDLFVEHSPARSVETVGEVSTTDGATDNKRVQEACYENQR